LQLTQGSLEFPKINDENQSYTKLLVAPPSYYFWCGAKFARKSARAGYGQPLSLFAPKKPKSVFSPFARLREEINN
jgi:hypothetical protein